jgi:hypothetical protein
VPRPGFRFLWCQQQAHLDIVSGRRPPDPYVAAAGRFRSAVPSSPSLEGRWCRNPPARSNVPAGLRG